MLDKLKSRKLWAMVVGAALTAFGGELGIRAEHTAYAVGIIVAYILGQSVVDAAEKRKAIES